MEFPQIKCLIGFKNHLGHILHQKIKLFFKKIDEFIMMILNMLIHSETPPGEFSQ